MNELLIQPKFAHEMAAKMSDARARYFEMQQSIEGKKQLSWEELFRCRRKTTIDENGIANVHVYGLLGSKWDGIWKILGLVTDYDDVAEELDALREDKRVLGVFLDNESGGGMALGCGPLAAKILSFSQSKPVLSYTDYVSASACYYLGCGATAFYASKDGIVGSVGTRLDWLTFEGYLTSFGVKQVEMAGSRSTLKHAGTDLREPSEDERKFLQESLDATNEAFVSHVQTARPGINEEVFKAGYYFGTKAEEFGLIDGIATRQEAYNDLLTLAKPA